MKIHKKDKQQMFSGLLKHTPPPALAASSASSSPSSSLDQNHHETQQPSQNPLPAIPRHLVVGPKDQLRLLTPVGSSASSNHRTATIKASLPLKQVDDDDGGGGRVKKKRKKKDKRDKAADVGDEQKGGGKPKRRKEEKERGPAVLVLSPRKSKQPKDGKERKERKFKKKDARKDNGAGVIHVNTVGAGVTVAPIKIPGKRGRKPKIKILPPIPPSQGVPSPPVLSTKVSGHLQASPVKGNGPAHNYAPPSAPKQRGRKPKVAGSMPVEKKKKGKRRKEEVLQEVVESDDTTSTSGLTVGGEDSQDPLDSSRRSGRQVKRRKYNEDLDFKVVDDDGETIAVLGAGRISALNATALAWQAEEPPEDEANIIEKILSVRPLKKETLPDDQSDEPEEFYVKYRNFSYMHCKWATLEELEKDPRIHQKIKRFRTKQAQTKHIFTEPDEDLFNPDYVEVDRVLEVAVTTDTETGEEVTHYLVKWCSLSYEEATWELQEDLDPEKIKEFQEIQKPPPELRHVERPSPEKWQKLERSRDYRNGNQLREYQLEGMNWLLFNWYNRKNCILADEMGLGKTIQSITFLYEMFNLGIRGPFLIIAPLSTITNWEREFRTWTHLNVIVYHGSQISRQMILQYEMFYRDAQGNTIPGGLKFHGLITTFEMIMADCPELKKLNWRCVVIDEAHRLKNRNCKLLEGLKLMNLEHKVLLTGTPLQNSVEELFSLLNFLEPQQFPSESTFLEEFGDLKTEEQVKKLQAILKPMMLRRLKDDVEKNLAPKEETIIEVELTNIQKKYYRAILEKNFSFLSKGANQHNMPNLINTMMELRKCCNHPYLITGAEEKILESFRKYHSPDAPDFQLQAMIQAAGKLVLIDKLLPKLLSGGHKVLVFSQMVRCLDILEDYLIQRRYTYERIDGRVRGNMRQAAIDRFCKPDSDRFVFLLCTRAGGLGINLTAADTCIIFDSDWNPQNDLQAQARCHRIGQSKAVKVYRLITRNSYEREMFDKASLKLGLDKAVLQDINRKGSLNGVQQLSKLEVEDLLKKGAYGALMDEEDEGSKFCEEDIDQILQRRTQTITIQSEGKGSTFAKASFVSSGNRTDISLDDPNFWQKWAKIAEVEIDSRSEKESLVIDTPRIRKQTRHYNSFEDDELMEFSELDSDSEDRPCRTRRMGERGRRYLRAECFRVEKNLLIFGWGRWKDILNHGRFKWHLAERDMEVICRALLVYCLKHYKGDDKIKSFIWDLIAPTKDGREDHTLLNHSGLLAPVPRGRKGKKMKSQGSGEVQSADWLVHCNPEIVLQDESYKKHLKQHCNKVLLRVRMLYYLKVEVLGEAATQALEGVPASKLEVTLPDIDYIEIPASWWDVDADKSLLIGVHKHGYERYNAMRADPELCFLERVGMPDVTALSQEQGGAEASADMADSCKTEEAKEDTESKAEGGVEREETEKGGEESSSTTNTSEKPDSTALELPPAPDSQTQLSLDLSAQDATLVTTTTTGSGMGVAALQLVQTRPLWPSGPALTARLRRLITSYQRFTLRREPMLRHDFLLHDGLVAMGMGGGAGHHGHLSWQLGEELRRCTVVPTEADPLFLEWQRRWTRREQADFYRTISSFGVVFDPERKVYDWSQFRALARLERKTDESLERYFNSFVHMCRTACKLPPRKEEGLVDPALVVEPLTEERAARTLYRIELLRKIREQVLRHPLLSSRLQLCRPSLYLPVWWESGKHDRDLLLGAARHGLSRTDFYILNDPQLTFLEAHRNYVRGHPSHHHHAGMSSHPGMPPTSAQIPHCCMYDSGIQPPDYHHQTHQHHAVPSPAQPLDPHEPAQTGLGMPGARTADFMDCPSLDESLELGSLQHDADALHGGKGSKDALNGFPFNSAAGGQSMLNSYGVGAADLGSKLRSDVLVGEQGSSEESGLMAPSVELNHIQAPWDTTEASSPAHHMFNESDPILGPSGLEPGFLEEDEEDTRGADRAEEGATLEECLGLPPSASPSHTSAGDASTYMLFKDIGVTEEPSADQTDLSVSPPPPYVPPTPLSLSDITEHGTQDGLDRSDVSHATEEGEGQDAVAGFPFDGKDKEEEMQRNGDSEHMDTEGGTDPVMMMDVSGDLQGTYSETVDPFLGKLDQDTSLACSESLGEPGEDVDQIILYQAMETGNSLNTDVLMDNATDNFLETPNIQKECIMQNNIEAVSAGKPDPVSLMEVQMLQPDEDGREKAVKESENSQTNTQPSDDGVQVKSEATADEDVKSEAAVDEVVRSSFENKIKPHPSLFQKSTDFSNFLANEEVEKKPQHLLIKMEHAKEEEVLVRLADATEEKTLVCLVKEEMSTKSKQLDIPIKDEGIPENLSLKQESIDNQVYSDEIKSETKPFEFQPSFTEVKAEAKAEDLSMITDSVKLEVKTEGLELCADGRPVKAEPGVEGLETGKEEAKQVPAEADSTVVTPRTELAEGAEGPENFCKSQGKEERIHTPGSPRFATPMSMCDVPESLHECREREPTIAQLLQEKALYSFSEWPKDRVIINRLDSVCHAILKGKWPSSNEQYDSPANASLANSLAQQRAGFLSSSPASAPGQARVHAPGAGLSFPLPPPLTRLPKFVSRGGAVGRGGAWRLTSLPLLQERLVAPPYLPELKRGGARRPFDYEAAAKALTGKMTPGNEKSGSPHCPLPLLMNGWQETAMDLTKSSGGGQEEGAKKAAQPPISAPLPGLDITGILQAGLIHPVTGQIVNGSMRGDEALRRRRGRRRNVEALYSEFTKGRGLPAESQARVEAISHSAVSSSTSSPSPSPSERPAGSSTPTPPTHTPPQPEIVAIDREAASKGLIEWLRQNPGYSMELPAFAHTPGASVLHGFIERPKQRRHRCKDPSKLDVNSLTGEERVPVVHRGTGRRLGGAMAPAIKELSRWLDANTEYFVAPDWSDVVKHSGYLPEGKFSRILTEPVNRDAARRRGRRPRSEMPKPLLSVSDAPPTTLGPPIFMNGGLIGSMDTMVAMQNLRGATIPGLPISGVMAAGFPHGFPGASSSSEDAKNGLSMLPMMLHGIPHGATIPQHAMLSVGMMAHAPPTKTNQSDSASPNSSSAEKELSSANEKDKSKDESSDVSKKSPTTSAAAIVEQAAIITSTSRGHIGTAHSSHLTFNPFLIPGMSHGLLYPHMFLPHGGIMALPAMPPGAVDGVPPGSPKRRRKKEDEMGDEGKELKAGTSSQPLSQTPPPAENKGKTQESQDSQEDAALSGDAQKQEVAEEQRQANGEEG
ncbi:unnamed protein product [Knipowitschia caucasica]